MLVILITELPYILQEAYEMELNVVVLSFPWMLSVRSINITHSSSESLCGRYHEKYKYLLIYCSQPDLWDCTHLNIQNLPFKPRKNSMSP